MAAQSSGRETHIERQRQYFNALADLFCRPVPLPIEKRTRRIVAEAHLDPLACVLDVGCGTGAIIKHLIESGVRPSNIVGCDLSELMIERARLRFPDVFFWRGDVVDLPGVLQLEFPEHLQSFDSVIFNGCFGNMWDQEGAFQAALHLLGGNGQIVISHPMGSDFVDRLHQNEPHIVPHRLPDIARLRQWCERFAVELILFEDVNEHYLAILKQPKARNEEHRNPRNR